MVTNSLSETSVIELPFSLEPLLLNFAVLSPEKYLDVKHSMLDLFLCSTGKRKTFLGKQGG